MSETRKPDAKPGAKEQQIEELPPNRVTPEQEQKVKGGLFPENFGLDKK
jgi:hypothetical protein